MSRAVRNLPRRALCAALVAWILPCQGHGQALTPITTSNEFHLGARISPDGLVVLYRTGPGKIGRVSLASGLDTSLVTSAQNDLFDYLWDPGSLEVYYLQGSVVRSIARSGGNPLFLATIGGTNVRIWCVDGAGERIYGTRRDGGLHHIFSLSTSGGLPQDLISSASLLEDVRVDPSGITILYRSGPAQPFGQNRYFRADADGQNPTELQATFSGASATWLDAGLHFVMTSLTDTFPLTFALGRVDSVGNLEFLTGNNHLVRRSSVSADGRWILFEASNPRDGGVNPGVIPTTGGGAVMLASGQDHLLNGGSVIGGLSVDAQSALVAFSASRLDVEDDKDQIYVVGLDREIRVHPRVEVASSFQIELPVSADELGAVALSIGVDPSGSITLPGVTGAFELLAGPGQAALVLSGTGTGAGPLVRQMDVPNLPDLVGVDFYFQGLRLQPDLTGGFTRWGWFTIF